MYPPHFHDHGIVPVRGVQIRITPEIINQHFGIVPQPHLRLGYPELLLFSDHNSELAASLRMSGEGVWHEGDGSIRHRQLHIDATFWQVFSDFSLRPTKRRTTLIMETARLIHYIRAGLALDIGVLIRDEILHVGRRLRGVLPFPCLITHICASHGLDVYAEAECQHLHVPLPNMNRTTYNDLARRRGLPLLGVPEPQPLAEDEDMDDVLAAIVDFNDGEDDLQDSPGLATRANRQTGAGSSRARSEGAGESS
ncbi:hypothetical protein ACOSP7_000358 [Xanthoceras sorbifolium]